MQALHKCKYGNIDLYLVCVRVWTSIYMMSKVYWHFVSYKIHLYDAKRNLNEMTAKSKQKNQQKTAKNFLLWMEIYRVFVIFIFFLFSHALQTTSTRKKKWHRQKRCNFSVVNLCYLISGNSIDFIIIYYREWVFDNTQKRHTSHGSAVFWLHIAIEMKEKSWKKLWNEFF